MKLNSSNNNHNYLLLYSAGTGGEMITSLLSECVPEINKIPRKEAYPIGTNRWHSNCKITYSLVKKECLYEGENDPNKYDLYKDHYHSYDPNIIKEYWDSSMTVICFTVTRNYGYWANLGYRKLKEQEKLTEHWLKNHSNK